MRRHPEGTRVLIRPKATGEKGRRQTMRAALYARVSSEEQVEGYSIDAQRRAF